MPNDVKENKRSLSLNVKLLFAELLNAKWD